METEKLKQWVQNGNRKINNWNWTNSVRFTIAADVRQLMMDDENLYISQAFFIDFRNIWHNTKNLPAVTFVKQLNDSGGLFVSFPHRENVTRWLRQISGLVEHITTDTYHLDNITSSSSSPNSQHQTSINYTPPTSLASTIIGQYCSNHI